MGADRGSNDDRTGAQEDTRRRYTVREAAEALGITSEAVRTRISRGTLESVRDGRRVFVLLESDETRPNTNRTNDQTALVEILRDQVEYLRSELARREETHLEESRRKDSIIAALTQRIPEIEAPRQEPPGEPESAAGPGPSGSVPPEAERGGERPWWRRMFGD
jgi:excisionase family DNA binding protein